MVWLLFCFIYLIVFLKPVHSIFDLKDKIMMDLVVKLCLFHLSGAYCALTISSLQILGNDRMGNVAWLGSGSVTLIKDDS